MSKTSDESYVAALEVLLQVRHDLVELRKRERDVVFKQITFPRLRLG